MKNYGCFPSFLILLLAVVFLLQGCGGGTLPAMTEEVDGTNTLAVETDEPGAEEPLTEPDAGEYPAEPETDETPE